MTLLNSQEQKLLLLKALDVTHRSSIVKSSPGNGKTQQYRQVVKEGLCEHAYEENYSTFSAVRQNFSSNLMCVVQDACDV